MGKTPEVTRYGGQVFAFSEQRISTFQLLNVSSTQGNAGEQIKLITVMKRAWATHLMVSHTCGIKAKPLRHAGLRGASRPSASPARSRRQVLCRLGDDCFI